MLNKKNVLLCLADQSQNQDIAFIASNFCGIVVYQIEDLTHYLASISSPISIYICGNVENLNLDYDTLYIIKELSTGNMVKNNTYVSVGQVPINIHNVGVFFQKFFNTEKDIYNSIVNEHEFQSLTLSKKPAVAHRKGIYLSNVNEQKDGTVSFNLLRCSTNLSGPTDNFRSTDKEILEKVNEAGQSFFDGAYRFNHVLAQTYHNTNSIDDPDNKQRKARISEHSDKTKDMPSNALMAFCTFYKDYSGDQFTDGAFKHGQGFDYVYGQKNETVLTKLRFRLKSEAAARDDTLTKQFDITLYPNSVFLMSLLTNRLYTHEIVPSSLPVEKIPTRMGYVIRCSNTNAIFKDGTTFIESGGDWVPLVPPTDTGIKELTRMYKIENTTIDILNYQDKFFFSMNSGDYKKPIL
ncbi:hypothetical protein BC833DRAFT_275034 [Globomyces pollinis-pini]|nr:hypothetical protein BC833DRAFT_275034 [Globomyces pollinis-pini]